jgi:hypothetical protein
LIALDHIETQGRKCESWRRSEPRLSTKTPSGSAPASYITSNPGLFKSGDIFDGDPEAENSAYWVNTGVMTTVHSADRSKGNCSLRPGLHRSQRPLGLLRCEDQRVLGHHPRDRQFADRDREVVGMADPTDDRHPRPVLARTQRCGG